VLGLVFWVVAARLLSTGDVGIGTAIVTSIVLLGNVATLGLRSGLIRFMSAAGSSAGRFIATAYGLCAVVAIVLAAGFVIGTPLWAEELIVLRQRPIDAVLFALACAVWTVFVLQDHALTGLRQAVWVPVENLGYSIAKLAMVVLLASTGAWALPVAWSVPALIAAVPVNVLVFGHLLREGNHRPADETIFTVRAIARFSIGDHAADMIRLLGAEVVVLFVLANRGAEDTAFVFFAMTIAATGQLVTANIVTAFIAEASARPTHALDLARRAATQSLAVIVPGALVGVAVAPFVLRVFGSTYADNGTTLLRLLCLGAIPLAVVGLALGWARVQRDIWLVIRIAAATAAAPLSGILVFERWWGIDAIGWASLLGYSLLAVVLARTTLRPVWSVEMLDGVVEWLGARRSTIRRSRRAGAIAATLDELDAIHPDGPALSPRRLLPSDNDVAVVKVDADDRPLIVKIAVSDRAAHSLARHADALAAVRAAAAGRPDVLSFLPEVVESGECQGQRYVIETACGGETALVADHDTLVAITRGVSAVHALQPELRVVDDALLDELVTRHVNVLLSDRRLWEHVGEIHRLWAVLRAGLLDRQVVVTRTHGDCWIGNALLCRDDRGLWLGGLVDWEDSREEGLADVDLAHLWLSAQPGHLGAATVDAIAAGVGWEWRSDLGLAMDDGPIVDAAGDALDGEVMLVLAWLHHVAAGLSRAERFSLGGRWLAANVVPVLESVPMLEEFGWDQVRGREPADAG
jgi:O-antigen/teichoic acid export membrane protein